MMIKSATRVKAIMSKYYPFSDYVFSIEKECVPLCNQVLADCREGEIDIKGINSLIGMCQKIVSDLNTGYQYTCQPLASAIGNLKDAYSLSLQVSANEGNDKAKLYYQDQCTFAIQDCCANLTAASDDITAAASTGILNTDETPETTVIG